MDKKLRELINKEIVRQQETIDLIPSENIADPELLRIIGSPLVNKYSEGYPGRRYYPGNTNYDKLEELAQSAVLKAFRLREKDWHVNVQPYSGSPANQAVLFALLKPGDTLMGLALSHGGHLTHGHSVNFSGTLYRSVPYTVDAKAGLIDYENLKKLAKRHKPKVIFSGLTAYSRRIDFKRIGDIAKSVGAYHVADISHVAGLVIAGAYPSPFAYADIVTTTTHKTIRGPRGAVIISRKKKRIPERIDRAVFPGLQGGPHNNVTAGIAYAFMLAQKEVFKRYQRQVARNAKVLAGALRKRAFTVLAGETDNHLFVLDLRKKGISGVWAERALEQAGILANRNTIPEDTSAFLPSGIRLGTPTVTSRGMKEKEMQKIAEWIDRLLTAREAPARIQKEVRAFCKRFPLKYKKL